ncbi:MAG: hypothetical protein ACREKB_11175 [Candidatus Rokuibacteriota bacterium]
MALAKVCALALLVLASSPVLAHEAHKSSSPPATTPPAADPEAPALEETVEQARPDAPPIVVDPKAALFHHPHNKIVHFPIALGSAGAILLLLSYRWPQFGAGARLLLVVAALTAWMAVRSGQAQEEALEGGELGEWLGRHEDFGKWTAVAFTVTALAALIKQARPVHWLLALLALGLVSYTGFLGGILSHTPM